MFRALGCRGLGLTVSESTVLELYRLRGESSGLRVSPQGAMWCSVLDIYT